MALNTTDADGRHDFAIPPNVRIYHFAGTQHGGGDPLNQPPRVLPTAPNNCQLLSNSNPFIPAQRALLVALQQWITHGTEPPPSLYSTLARGSLVPVTRIKIPYIPAVHFTLPGVAAQRFHLDRGPDFDEQDVSGVMGEPPAVGGAYAELMPQVDADGNDIDGLRNTNVQVPLGTYTGWNIRKAGFSEGDSCDLTGAFIPFFKTKTDRMNAGDPRLSLAERYPTHADYVAKVTAAANRLVKQRLLLQQDADRIIQQANDAAVPLTAVVKAADWGSQPEIEFPYEFVVVEFLGGAALEGDLAMDDDIAAIGDAHRLVEVLLGHQHGQLIALLQLLDLFDRALNEHGC
jgi:hypothetical protein